MNVGRVRFRSAPSFYAGTSSRPLAQLIDERTAAIYDSASTISSSPRAAVRLRCAASGMA
jgi:hypothetical protein